MHVSKSEKEAWEDYIVTIISSKKEAFFLNIIRGTSFPLCQFKLLNDEL